MTPGTHVVGQPSQVAPAGIYKVSFLSATGLLAIATIAVRP
jgi:hypothetical protein